MEDAGGYNQRNELRTRSVKDWNNPTTARTVSLLYDLNGNLTDDGEKYEYTFNPWGQLTQIRQRDKSTVVANFTYNGLGQRISEQTDTSSKSTPGVGDDVVDSDDPVFFIAVDTQGRRVATYRGTDDYAKELFVFHPDGLRGPAFQGGVMLRMRDNHADDPTTYAGNAASGEFPERYFYTSDYRGNVSAIISSTGVMIEQYRYSPSGVPFGIPQGDVNADGVVDGSSSGGGGADYAFVNAHFGGRSLSTQYDLRADINLDGVVDADDLSLVATRDGTGVGRGRLSAGWVASRSWKDSEQLLRSEAVISWSWDFENSGTLEWIKVGISSRPVRADLVPIMPVLVPGGGLIPAGEVAPIVCRTPTIAICFAWGCVWYCAGEAISPIIWNPPPINLPPLPPEDPRDPKHPCKKESDAKEQACGRRAIGDEPAIQAPEQGFPQGMVLGSKGWCKKLQENFHNRLKCLNARVNFRKCMLNHGGDQSRYNHDKTIDNMEYDLTRMWAVYTVWNCHRILSE